MESKLASATDSLHIFNLAAKINAMASKSGSKDGVR